MEEHVTDPAIEARIAVAERFFTEAGLTAIAQAAENAGERAPLDEAGIERVRSQFALPAVESLIRAAAHLAWLTAEPGTKLGDLMLSLTDMADAAAMKVSSGPMPAGEYWITVASDGNARG